MEVRLGWLIPPMRPKSNAQRCDQIGTARVVSAYDCDKVLVSRQFDDCLAGTEAAEVRNLKPRETHRTIELVESLGSIFEGGTHDRINRGPPLGMHSLSSRLGSATSTGRSRPRAVSPVGA